MRDGLYRLRFQSALGWGSGVLYAAGGRVWGGDGVIYYTGTLMRSEGIVDLVVTTERHTANPAMKTIFGADHGRIVLRGPADDATIKLEGSPDDAPGLLMVAEMTWLTD
jgi:hypothetical protein